MPARQPDRCRDRPQRRPAGIRLSEIEAGQRATIYRITEEAEEDAGLLSYLEARALTPGAHVTILARSNRSTRSRSTGRAAGRPSASGPPRSSASCRARPIRACSTSVPAPASAPRMTTLDVRVRIAPSPTGPLHIGTARTALFNFLYARHIGGTFILRLEDTDVARSSVAYEKDILDGLHWLGLSWDEGPEVAGEAARGPYAPYRQMERLPLYAAAAERLLAADLAYPCYCTPEELDADRRRQEAAKQPPRYVGRCANLTPEERAAREAEGRRPALRFRVGEGVVGFDDIVRGHVEIDVANLGGDFVIVRGDGTPLYHFTVVVDDAAMEISHVIRGEDHLSNTPKHILLFRALGHQVPRVRPPAADPQPRPHEDEQAQEPDRDRRLHRRGLHPRGARQLPRAARLVDRHRGGDPLARRARRALRPRRDVHKGGAVFDRERLEWLNGQWIRRLDPDDLIERLRPFLEAELAAGRIDRMPRDEELRALLPIVQERLPTLGAIGDLVGFLWVDDLPVDPAAARPEALGRRDDASRRCRGRARRRSPRPARSLRGRRARAAAARARRGARLEGRRPVHGDPRRGHRSDRDAAAVRHAGRARPRADPRAARRRDRGPG